MVTPAVASDRDTSVELMSDISMTTIPPEDVQTVAKVSYPRPFGKYVLVAPLARGGMGELHLALSGLSDLKKLCVIKQILDHLADGDLISRFLDEVKLVVKLSHGNLVPVFEGGVVNGRYFLAMEHIEGINLRAFWKLLKERKMCCPVDVALHICKELCRGLSYAHTYGDLKLVHRDVSPPNVLLSYSGEIKLTDFGLARTRLKQQKTAPGVLFGKLAYMAPEQVMNEDVDARTDIYAVGVILWELLSGCRLFPQEGTQLEQLRQVADPKIEPPSTRNKQLDPLLDLIVLRALAPRKEDRYPTAEALRRDLANCLARISPTTDNASLQNLLKTLCGGAIEQERRDRENLLSTLTPAIKQMRLSEATSKDAFAKAARPNQPSKASMHHPSPSASSSGGPTFSVGFELAGRYRIESVIREGGMGTVYLATHVGLEKQVAVKVLHPVFRGLPDILSRFRREAKAASRIGHPNIIELFDSGITERGNAYFAMEYLVGQDLGDLLSAEAPLPIDRSLHIAVQICKALAAAHEAGIIHRDLKPENIFLMAKDGEMDFVKVLDFGIAQTSTLGGRFGDRLTDPGMTIGTPEYMAPEQAFGDNIDHRADIYALGAIVYEMLCGSPPHFGRHMVEVLDKKASEPIAALGSKRADTPASLERIVHWALESDPEKRPQSMRLLSYELTKIRFGRAGAVASMLGLRGGAMAVQGKPPAFAPSDTGDHVAIGSAAISAKMLALKAELDHDERWNQTDHLRQKKSKMSSITRSVLLIAVVMLGLTSVAGVLHFSSIRRSVTAEPERSTLQAQQEQQKNLRPSRHQKAENKVASGKHVRRPRTHRKKKQRRRIRSQRRKRADSRLSARSSAGLLKTGRHALMAGDFETAKIAFKKAQRSQSMRPRALLGLAEVYFQTGHYRKAKELANKARKKGAGLRSVLLLGNISFKLGRYGQACEYYQKVLDRLPHHAEASRNLLAARKLKVAKQ